MSAIYFAKDSKTILPYMQPDDQERVKAMTPAQSAAFLASLKRQFIINPSMDKAPSPQACYQSFLHKLYYAKNLSEIYPYLSKLTVREIESMPPPEKAAEFKEWKSYYVGGAKLGKIRQVGHMAAIEVSGVMSLSGEKTKVETTGQARGVVILKCEDAYWRPVAFDFTGSVHYVEAPPVTNALFQ